MKVFMLSLEEQAEKKADLAVEFTHEDLTEATANTAQTLSPFTCKANDQAVECVQAELKEAFEDTADAAFNSTAITIGDAGSAARLLASMELNKNGTEVYLKAGTGTTYAPTSDTVVTITVNSMTAKSLSSLNKGRAVAYFRIRDRRGN